MSKPFQNPFAPTTPAKPAAPPARAGVSKHVVQPPAMPPEPKEEDIQVLTARETSMATRIDSTQLEGAEPTTETETTTLPEWAHGFDATDLAKLDEYKTDEDLKKALLHAQRKLGQQGSEKAGMEAMVRDILAAQRAAPAPTVDVQVPVQPPMDLKKLAEEIESTWLDDPRGNVTKMMDAATKIAAAQVQSVLDKRQADADQKATNKIIMREKAYLESIGPAARVLVDAMASVSPGETAAEKYEYAIAEYKKEKQPVSTTVTAAERLEAEAMRLAAQASTAPNAPSGGGEKKKIYSREWLGKLQILEPAKYRELQPKIMAAYREGRVK